MKQNKGKILTGTILIVISPIIYILGVHFAMRACREVIYVLCNYTPLGMLYVPGYVAVGIALLGTLLFVLGTRQKNK
jgi:hypothetical protein